MHEVLGCLEDQAGAPTDGSHYYISSIRLKLMRFDVASVNSLDGKRKEEAFSHDVARVGHKY